MTRRAILLIVVVTLLGTLIRWWSAGKRSLWADETFSLAIATAHSLEQPASISDPRLGDFIQTSRPVTAASLWRQYAERDGVRFSPRAILRATKLSDTSPPLYYLLLGAWTVPFGSNEAALRAFSVFFSVACIPLVALVGWRLGGVETAILAALFFALAPESTYFGVEGRMYSLLCFVTLVVALLALRLRSDGSTWWRWIGWVLGAVAGLLTHYFFAFVWGAMVLWLLVHPGRVVRRDISLAIAAACVLVAPWYVGVPSELAAWRITKGWLELRPGQFSAVTAQLGLLWSYVAPSSGWGYATVHLEKLFLLLILAMIVAAIFVERRRLLRPEWQFAWLWLLAANLGLLVFDIAFHTYVRAVPRYAIAGLPAACIALAWLIASLPGRVSVAAAAVVLVAWLPVYNAVRTGEVRGTEPGRDVAAAVNALADTSDIVILHSIPSGALAVARYLRPDLPVAVWVQQLGVRTVPGSVDSLVAGRRRAFVLSIHAVGAPMPEARYLAERGTIELDRRIGGARLLEFVLSPSSTSAAHP